MNRQQRQVQAINGVIREAVKEAQINTMRLVIHDMMAAFVISLNNEFDFGPKRMRKLLDNVKKQYECIEAGTVTIEDIKQWCKDNKMDYEEFIPNVIKEK